jgi:hypothetical protein
VSQSQFVYGVDQSASPPGTPLVAAYLNSLVQAQTMLLSGAPPSLSGSLTLTQPGVSAIWNDGTSHLQTISAAGTSLTLAATHDTYVELTSSGTLVQHAVTNGAANPGLQAGSILQLYKAVSDATAVTAITPLATACAVGPGNVAAPDEATTHNPPVAPTDSLQQTIWRILYKLASGLGAVLQPNVSYDSTEVSSSGGAASLVDNLNHLRQAVQSLTGQAFGSVLAGSAQRAILADGTNASSAGVALPGPLALGAAATVPLLSLGPGAPSGAAVVTTGLPYGAGWPANNDVRGAFTFNTAPGTLGGSTDYDVAHLRFGTPYAVVPVILTDVQGIGHGNQYWQPYITNKGTSGFDLHVATYGGTAQTLAVYVSYLVVG